MPLQPNHPRIRRHSAQHDDHCLLTAGGQNWRIVRMLGLGHIELRSLDGVIGAVLSLSHADLDTYCAWAAIWLAPDLSIDNAEIVDAA